MIHLQLGATAYVHCDEKRIHVMLYDKRRVLEKEILLYEVNSRIGNVPRQKMKSIIGCQQENIYRRDRNKLMKNNNKQIENPDKCKLQITQMISQQLTIVKPENE